MSEAKISEATVLTEALRQKSHNAASFDKMERVVPLGAAQQAVLKAASLHPQPAELAEQQGVECGYVIADGTGEKFMAWGQVGPEWVADRSAALWLVRRADAEALAAENEDAWLILPVERCALPPAGWSCTLMAGHAGPCPTLAATGKQQVGEAAILRNAAAVLDMWEGDPNVTGYMGDFKDACAILEVLALHAAPTAQQVGEVQGCDELRLRTDGERAAYLEGIEEGKAKAARQPVAQEEVTDAEVEKAWNRFEAALQAPHGDTPEDRVMSQTIDQRDRYHEVSDELADHLARIIGVEIGEHSSVNCPWQNAIDAAEAYQPAQGIDLGQFRRPVEEWRADMERWVEVHGDYRGAFASDIAEGNRLLALIDGQRDAAPGVGNG